MMTLEHRKADICNQMFNQNLAGMVGNLAAAAEALEIAQAKIAEYEKREGEKMENRETPSPPIAPPA